MRISTISSPLQRVCSQWIGGGRRLSEDPRLSGRGSCCLTSKISSKPTKSGKTYGPKVTATRALLPGIDSGGGWSVPLRQWQSAWASRSSSELAMATWRGLMSPFQSMDLTTFWHEMERLLRTVARLSGGPESTRVDQRHAPLDRDRSPTCGMARPGGLPAGGVRERRLRTPPRELTQLSTVLQPPMRARRPPPRRHALTGDGFWT